MRKLVLVLSIVLVLGIVVVSSASAAPLTREFIAYLREGGFDILTPKEGGWLASYTDEATKATTWITFSTDTEVTKANVIFLTYTPGIDYTAAFAVPIAAIQGLFPSELNESVIKAIMGIPELQRTASDGSARLQVGNFTFKGGFFNSPPPDSCLGFMLDIEAVGVGN